MPRQRDRESDLHFAKGSHDDLQYSASDFFHGTLVTEIGLLHIRFAPDVDHYSLHAVQPNCAHALALASFAESAPVEGGPMEARDDAI